MYFDSTYLASALPRSIHAGAFFGLRITGRLLSPGQEAVTGSAVREVPVTTPALCTLCTREFWMTGALARVYVALEIQGSHRATVASLRRRPKQQRLTPFPGE